MPQRQFKRVRSLAIATFSAIAAVLAAAASVFAGSTGGPFP
jgi:hypothetical protein